MPIKETNGGDYTIELGGIRTTSRSRLLWTTKIIPLNDLVPNSGHVFMPAW